MLVFQAAAGQMGTHLMLVQTGKLIPYIVDWREIRSLNLLLEVCGIQVIAKVGFTAVSRDDTQNGLQQSGFAHPVAADNGNFLAALNRHIQFWQQRPVVANLEVQAFEYRLAAGPALLERERRLRRFLRTVNPFHPVKLLLTAFGPS
ncbi:hypothetical protein D3C73_852040 [compost metagenome]